jgi:hypothetical protein
LIDRSRIRAIVSWGHRSFSGSGVWPMQVRRTGRRLLPCEVSVRPWLPVLLTACLIALAPSAVWAALPAVARPSVPTTSASESPGVVFFLGVRGEPGVVAVGTAHTLPLAEITKAGKVEFYSGTTMRRLGSSSRFLAPPGKPFSLPGASLVDDFLVFALDAVPKGARVLTAIPGPPPPRARVKVLGVPSRGKKDEEKLYGTMVSATDKKIEIDLDLDNDLRGWGGAPIVLSNSNKVIGFVQAVVPTGDTARVFATPISVVQKAIAKPLEGGAGRAIASFDADARSQPAALAPERPMRPSTRTGGPVLRQGEPTRMLMDIEYPPANAIVADSVCGVFVAGRARAHQGKLRRFDVVMVLDTSRSTIDPSGTDIDGDGRVGRQRLGRLGSIFNSGGTDPGDSILAAEVAAARTLLNGLDSRSTRVGLVTFAGYPPGYGRGAQPAYTLEPLTDDFGRIEHSLDFVLGQAPEGSTHMAAGVDQATIELLGLRGSASRTDPDSDKIVFFFTDGQPTLPYGPEAQSDNVRAVLRAANRAGRGNIRIHSFAIGPDALEGPIAVVEMASRTDGYFTPVRHPGDLINVVEEVNFANLDSMALFNKTLDKPAKYFNSTADGTWAGLVPMREGKNELRAWARADNGAEIDQLRTVKMDGKTKESPPIPKQLAVRRNRLLEECLRDTKRLRLTAEEEAAEKVRRDLKIEIEKERQRARERADQQRKELELEGDIGEDEPRS